MEFLGVSESSLHRGLALLVVAAVVHGAAVAACVEAGVMFRDGQVRVGLLIRTRGFHYRIAWGLVLFVEYQQFQLWFRCTYLAMCYF